MTNIQEILDKIGKLPISKPKMVGVYTSKNWRTSKKVFVFDKNGELIDTLISTKHLRKLYGEGAYDCLTHEKPNKKGLSFSYNQNFICKKKFKGSGRPIKNSYNKNRVQ